MEKIANGASATNNFTVRLPHHLMTRLHAHCIYREQREGVRISYSQAIGDLIAGVSNHRVDEKSLKARELVVTKSGVASRQKR